MAEVWASCGTDARVLLWRAGRPTPLQECALPAPACCVAFAADGQLLAAGMCDGSLALLKAAPLPADGGGGGGNGGGGGGNDAGGGGGGGGGGRRRGVVGVHSVARDGRVKAIEDVKFAPGSGLYAGGLLACGGHERTIDVYELVTDGRSGEHRLTLQLRSRCKGHSSTVSVAIGSSAAIGSSVAIVA